MDGTTNLTGNRRLIHSYLRQFGSKYLHGDVFKEYPETRVLPAYIKEHFSAAELVLDLGFGTGLWFWASFLPSLKRIDGFDLFPEALVEADRVFELAEVPEGYRAAHRQVGEDFRLHQLQELRKKRGALVIQDYRQPWPLEMMHSGYDLVTETGGGFAELTSDQELMELVSRCALVLNGGGRLFFVNFVTKVPSEFGRCLRENVPAMRQVRSDLFERAVRQAGLRMADFHSIEQPPEMPDVQTFLYGYAEKPGSRKTVPGV